MTSAVSRLLTTAEQARDELAALVPLAVRTLQDLASGAERESVRLAAAEAILDRTGVHKGAALVVHTDTEAHKAAEVAALDLVDRIARNRATEALPAPSPALDALVVLEGESDDLPLASGRYEGAVIDVHDHAGD